jgi:hypothetical protein
MNQRIVDHYMECNQIEKAVVNNVMYIYAVGVLKRSLKSAE